MGKIMEAIFCVIYLILTCVLGIKLLRKANGNDLIKKYGIMSLILVGGDSFHLIPRILRVINPEADLSFALGYGKMVTSITMTIFYVILYKIFERLYEKNKTINCSIIVLATIRILLCLLPQNDWAGTSPVIWGIIRNIPFAIIGLIIVALFFKHKDDSRFKWMWLAVTLSFAFYIPVVVYSDIYPIVGMLMMPKTIMYVWIVLMGFNL